MSWLLAKWEAIASFGLFAALLVFVYRFRIASPLTALGARVAKLADKLHSRDVHDARLEERLDALGRLIEKLEARIESAEARAQETHREFIREIRNGRAKG